MFKGRKNIMKYILVAIYVILSLSGLILMKKGGNAGSFSSSNGNLNFVINWISFFGLLCYLCSFLLFTRIVVMFDLSYIMPLTTGVVQVLTLVASKVVFKENISMASIVGASLVIIGIVVMNWKQSA